MTERLSTTSLVHITASDLEIVRADFFVSCIYSHVESLGAMLSKVLVSTTEDLHYTPFSAIISKFSWYLLVLGAFQSIQQLGTR